MRAYAALALLALVGCNTTEIFETVTSDASITGAVAPDAQANDATPVDGSADASDGFVCSPTASPHDAPCVLDLDAGIFVAPPSVGGSDITGTGSKTEPYATLGYAVTHAGNNGRIYVCAANFNEALTIISPVYVFGGLGCPDGGSSSWLYIDGGKAQVNGPVNQPALTVNGVTNLVTIEDMAFVASNAVGQDDAGNGRSSLAALINGSAVSFARCAFTAGAGAGGAEAGTPLPNYVGANAQDGVLGDSAGNGGAGGVANCVDGTSSFGGQGGNREVEGGTPGGDGGALPFPPTMPPYDGIGGIMATFVCGPGADPGANGLSGNAGALATAYGALAGDGWTPSAGGYGGNGSPGQGGGGSGATRNVAGVGGGAGGCGGAGGMGGRGGGASIGVACVASTVSLTTCMLRSGAGGAAGRGGNGQPGQGGGAYGFAVGTCHAGLGGNGAGGAGGAGGTGGISACVVYQGAPPIGAITCVLGTPGAADSPGAGGVGSDDVFGEGNPGSSGPDGGAGLAGTATMSLMVP